MSQPPVPPPPYAGPPGPYGGPPAKPGLSNKAKFWIGVGLALPALVVAGIVTGLAGGLGDLVAPGSGLDSVLAFVVGAAQLVLLVVGIVVERTRFLALGLISGFAILAVLAAGACVVLLVALTQAYQ